MQIQESLSNKEKQIQKLQAEIDVSEAKKVIAVNHIQQEVDLLVNNIQHMKENNQNAQELAISRAVGNLKKDIT